MPSNSTGPEPEAAPLPQDLQAVTARLDDNIHALAAGDKAIEDGALAATKYLFDLGTHVFSNTSSVSLTQAENVAIGSEARSQQYIAQLLESMGPAYAPKTRSQTKTAAEASRTEPSTSDAILKPTPLASLFVSNMGEDQVWAQLELKASNMCESLADLFGPAVPEEDGAESSDEDEDEDEEGGYDDDDDDAMEGLEGINGMDMDSLDSSEDGADDVLEEEFEDEEGVDSDDDESGDGEEDFVMSHRDSSGSDSDGSENNDQLDGPAQGSSKHPNRRKPRQLNAELDDDFFNLAEFNAETEEAESRRVTRGKLSRDDEDEDDEEEELDLFAPVGQDDELEEDGTDDGHSGEFSGYRLRCNAH
jgi:U3 small nucleolar RNA-associated protein MPP10